MYFYYSCVMYIKFVLDVDFFLSQFFIKGLILTIKVISVHAFVELSCNIDYQLVFKRSHQQSPFGT